MTSANNRYLVTGSTGFVGNRLINSLLLDGLTVRALTRKEMPSPGTSAIEYRCCDLTDPSSMHGIAEGIHTVFHLAGHAHTNTGQKGIHYQTSLDGTRNLLTELKRSHVKRCVYVSSVKAMPEPATDCLDEDATGKPTDEYGMSRYLAEKLLLGTANETGLHVSILRPALVYGPGCKGNLASMLRWTDYGLFPPIPETGNRRSMVGVDDLVHAIRLAAESSKANGQIFIITDNEQYSTRRIYNAMRSALGKPEIHWSIPVKLLHMLGLLGNLPGLIFRNRANFNNHLCDKLLGSSCFHSNKAATLLEYHPVNILEDVLPDMVENLRQQSSRDR